MSADEPYRLERARDSEAPLAVELEPQQRDSLTIENATGWLVLSADEVRWLVVTAGPAMLAELERRNR